ncbi:hypothetical protein VKT23_019394 [Stygiomarasmius scandens]|uniref:DNA ligase n=1 Tax=Marasmiellus scandens TaxID=2682957 RepID=A0ABR1ILK5_9AGAR
MSNEAVVPNKVPFTFFAALVRDIQGTVRRKLSNDKRERHNVALQVFARWKEKLYKEFSPLSPGTTTIIFRLLFPDVDFRRRYHMQEKALSLEIMECFGTNDARLRNWSKDGHSGCLGQEVKTVLEDTVSIPDGWVTTLSLQDVDRILDELASLSPWSHASVTTSQCSRRSRKEILKSLFRPLSPLDASVMTQIILRDLHCLLYPVPSDQSTTEALNSFNSSSFKKLTIEDAIRVWDPKNIMFKAYKGSSSLDEASIAFEGGKWMHSPKVGSFVSIPKSYKARSATDALQVFKSSDLIYAETKYDGERTQIHVEILDGLGPRLTIYSKSHRESTSDRIALHPIIIRCLGLNGPKPKIKKDVILDAEMVAFDGLHIDEFWKIHGLVETTATGVRSKPYRKTLTRYSSESRHLGLVFFDILCMDGASLLSVPYWKRRIILEDLIITEPGMALLSTRWL